MLLYSFVGEVVCCCTHSLVRWYVVVLTRWWGGMMLLYSLIGEVVCCCTHSLVRWWLLLYSLIGEVV